MRQGWNLEAKLEKVSKQVDAELQMLQQLPKEVDN